MTIKEACDIVKDRSGTPHEDDWELAEAAEVIMAQLHQATHCAVCDKPVQHPDGALHCKECVL